ncbi:MAG: octanoyltransferase [Deltaproteobacteria bacterium]|nr:MAG: octanoyltransferase [Deltaproteobacteria bacterium]
MAALFSHMGLIPYLEAHELQTRLVAARRAGDLQNDVFLVVEHPSVYTLGRRGGREFLMVSEAFLAARNIPVIPIERGGVITYHGPGQLVIYPILQLKSIGLSVTSYVAALEEVMLQLAAKVGVHASRNARNHGVWVAEKKLGSVGIAIRHGISFHGLALNVNPDMEPFQWINPCGLTNTKMTSLALETGREITIAEILSHLETTLSEVFATSLEPCEQAQLPRFIKEKS